MQAATLRNFYHCIWVSYISLFQGGDDLWLSERLLYKLKWKWCRLVVGGIIEAAWRENSQLKFIEILTRLHSLLCRIPTVSLSCTLLARLHIILQSFTILACTGFDQCVWGEWEGGDFGQCSFPLTDMRQGIWGEVVSPSPLEHL